MNKMYRLFIIFLSRRRSESAQERARERVHTYNQKELDQSTGNCVRKEFHVDDVHNSHLRLILSRYESRQLAQMNWLAELHILVDVVTRRRGTRSRALCACAWVWCAIYSPWWSPNILNSSAVEMLSVSTPIDLRESIVSVNDSGETSRNCNYNNSNEHLMTVRMHKWQCCRSFFHWIYAATVCSLDFLTACMCALLLLLLLPVTLSRFTSDQRYRYKIVLLLCKWCWYHWCVCARICMCAQYRDINAVLLFHFFFFSLLIFYVYAHQWSIKLKTNCTECYEFFCCLLGKRHTRMDYDRWKCM